jgi:hypothetical protein
MRNILFPVGHPEIITENFDEISSYFSLAKVKILPPKKLFYPVLPVKVDKKLLFCLCQKCAITKDRVCRCSDEERAITGTWTTIEIEEAIKHGYILLETYEVWHFKEKSVYDRI